MTAVVAESPARALVRPVPARAAAGRLPLPVAVLVALGAGLVFDAAFPDRGWWPLALPALALALWALRGRGFWAGVLVALVFGETFFLVHIEWATTFLGPLPWAALATVSGLYTAVSGGLIALAYRWVPRAWPGPAGRLLLVPAVVAGLWIAREGLLSVWPYGGFSWGRVGFSQAEAVWAPAFAWLGVAGVGFALVFVAALAVEAAAAALANPGAPGERSRPSLARLALLVLLPLLALAGLPSWTAMPGASDNAAGPATLRVGAVQGNTKAGYFDPPENVGDNLLAQAAATEPLFDEDVDVIVWPEGASDLDPLRVPGAARVWDEVSAAAGAPIVGGTITARPGSAASGVETEYFNTGLLWDAGRGALDYYDKKHPVPFGEYVPDRAFWRQFAPDLIDLIQREYTPGTTDAVVDLGAGDPDSPVSGVLAGVAICFDIVDDQLLTEIVEQGGQVVFAITNNADFGRTDESVQQLAFAQIRAIETARTVVNISTVGTSAIILPDGTIEQRLPTYEVGVLLADVPLSTTITPAVLAGRQLEWLAVFVGLAGLVVGFIGSRPGGRGSER